MALSHKDRAYEHIREKMLSGGIIAGTKLSEITLAKEIGISRTPVREAMAQLEVEGFVEQVPRQGSFVRTPDRRELEELYDIRAMLEGYAIARACRRMTPEQLDEIDGLCDHMRGLVRQLRDAGQSEPNAEWVRQWVLVDAAFHMLILDASGTRQVAKIVSDFRLLTHIVGHNRQDPDESRVTMARRTWIEHKHIARALRQRQSDAAAELIRSHIRTAKDRAVANYERSRSRDGGPAVAADWPASIQDVLSNLERHKYRARR